MLLPTGCPTPTQLSIRWAGQPLLLPLLSPKLAASISPPRPQISHPTLLSCVLFLCHSPPSSFLYWALYNTFLKCSNPQTTDLTSLCSDLISPVLICSLPTSLSTCISPLISVPCPLSTICCPLSSYNECQSVQHFPQVIQSIPRPLISPAWPLTSLLPTILRNILLSHHSLLNNPIVKKQNLNQYMNGSHRKFS